MPRKGENIYKRKDGRWEGRYIKSRFPTGKAKYGFVYARTYREVKKKLQEASVLRDSNKPISDGSSCVFRDISLEWLNAKKPLVKESTRNKYINLLKKYILPELGDLSLDCLTHDVIEKYCDHLLCAGGSKKTGLSPKTVSDVFSVIRDILRYATKKGIHLSLDINTIQIKQHTKEMRVLSRSEQEQLCRYLYSDLNPVNIGILVCLFTGIRVGEICALRWEDVSLSERTIHVHQTMQRIQNIDGEKPKTKIVVTSPKSACSSRTIPIPDELWATIARYKSTNAGYFLTNSTKEVIEPRTMQNRFKQALRRSNIEPVNFHTLRHTFATRCVELGFDVKCLSEILGHASVNITMNRYVHPSMELKQQNMERLSELFPVK